MDTPLDTPVHRAVETLAHAETPQELIAAHQMVGRAVRASRRRTPHGRLATVYTEAMTLWDQLKVNGVSLEDRQRGLETVLREVWPQTRAWHYLCPACDDVGLAMVWCPGDVTCGRRTPHLPHDFGEPCVCPRGARFREKPKPTPDDFAAAGKQKRMTRVGR